MLELMNRPHAWQKQNSNRHGYNMSTDTATTCQPIRLQQPTQVQHNNRHMCNTATDMLTTQQPTCLQLSNQHGYNSATNMVTIHQPTWLQFSNQHGYNSATNMATTQQPTQLQHWRLKRHIYPNDLAGYPDLRRIVSAMFRKGIWNEL